MTVSHEVAVIVKVNNKDVQFDVRRATGAQIKSAAIQQGVAIQQDFALFLKEGSSPLKPIADNEEVELHQHQEFRATAPDDNS